MKISTDKRRTGAILVTLAVLLMPMIASAQIDAAKAPFNLQGKSSTDQSSALQAALDQARGQ